MQTTTPRRSRIRLTPRGRLALVATGAVVVATAVAVPLLHSRATEEGPRALTVSPGMRAGQVFQAIDRALEIPPGTTERSLPQARLTLPPDARGNLEGYLFPATYPLNDKSTPQGLLRSMVKASDNAFGASPVTAGAQRNTVDVYQALIIASIVQAEAGGKAPKAGMGRVARVIYNRLDQGMPIRMRSTINYALHRPDQRVDEHDTRIESPYNTYTRMGLPPSPIGSPGKDAMRAALSPPKGDWLALTDHPTGR